MNQMFNIALIFLFFQIALFPKALSGKPIEREIIDFHTHYHSEANLGAILESMERNRISRSILLSPSYSILDERRAFETNHEVAKQVEMNPDKLIGFCAVRVSSEWYLREIIRCLDHLKLDGLKLHFGQEQFSLTRKSNLDRFEAIVALSHVYKIPVLVHPLNYDEEARTIVDTAIDYPDAKIILAHAVGTDWRRIVPITKYFKQDDFIPRNIYLETSTFFEPFAGSPEMENIVWHLRQFGTDRILFGSDNGADQAEALNAFLEFPFDEQERAAILGENAVEIFKEPDS